jgi:hypothetical protein
MTACSPLSVNRRFAGTYHLHLKEISSARNQQASRWQVEYSASQSDQSVLVSKTVLVLLKSGAPSDEGLGLISCSLCLLSLKFNIYKFTCIKDNIYLYIYTIYTRPLSVQAENSRSCPILGSSGYNGSQVTWTVVRLTAAKLKPLVFSFPGFALSNIANICILMILNDFCLLPG